jgi:hypothetical protein
MRATAFSRLARWARAFDGASVARRVRTATLCRDPATLMMHV